MLGRPGSSSFDSELHVGNNPIGNGLEDEQNQYDSSIPSISNEDENEPLFIDYPLSPLSGKRYSAYQYNDCLSYKRSRVQESMYIIYFGYKKILIL